MQALSFKRLAMAGITIMLGLAAMAPLMAAPDIDVVYISRTPRYDRYNVTYTEKIDVLDIGNPKPSLSKEEQAKQRWPKKGDIVTFTAVVKNPGSEPTGEFTYKWYFDGKEVESGKLASIEPGGKISTDYKWTWDSEWNNHTIKFVADPEDKVKENIETNNVIEDRTNALCYRFHVRECLYNWFLENGHKLNPDIATFEDWAQFQIKLMNDCFKNSTYPTAPNGVLERVRVDEVVYEKDSDPDPDPEASHAGPDWQWDGKWAFGKDYIEIFTSRPDFVSSIYSWGLHEHTHQLGMIDIYQMDTDKNTNNEIVPGLGHVNTRTGHVMASSEATVYSDLTVNALNNNIHKRRGYFGEYLYDLPKTCKVRLFDAYNRPMANATIKFYQDQSGKFKKGTPTFVGTTDSEGYYTMPNRSCHGPSVSATGHKLHDNPWGMINVVGFNGLFFCEITAANQKDYQYVEIIPFNLAYSNGYKDSWTYELQTTIVADGRVTSNDLYGIKMVSDKLGYAVGAKGTVLKWDGKTWVSGSTGNDRSLRTVDATSTTMLAAGDGGSLVIISNSGAARGTSSPTSNSLKASAILSDTTMLIGGENGDLYRTIDAGKTWTKITATDKTITGMDFFKNSGVLVCSDGSIFSTTDGGATWTKATGKTEGQPFTGCSMTSETEAWASAHSGDVFKSTDAGKTWTRYTQFGYALPWNCIDILPGDCGWVLGDTHMHVGATVTIYMRDGVWTYQPVNTFGDMGSFYGVSATSKTDAWAVGKNGLIINMRANRDF